MGRPEFCHRPLGGKPFRRACWQPAGTSSARLSEREPELDRRGAELP